MKGKKKRERKKERIKREIRFPELLGRLAHTVTS